MLERLADCCPVSGERTAAVDTTTLEANAAKRSIERRGKDESCEAFIRRIAEASGLDSRTVRG